MNMSTAQEFKCLNSDHYNTPHAVWKQRFCCSVAKLSDSLQNPRVLSSTMSCSLLLFTSIDSVTLSNHLILCCPLLFLLFVFPSIWVFSSESALCIRWPKYWSFSSSVSPSNKYSGLISFRIDWFDLLPVQLSSLLQQHSSETSILQCWAFFMVQLSHVYMTTGKTIALTRQTFVDKVMSLLFNMLSLSYLFFQGASVI